MQSSREASIERDMKGFIILPVVCPSHIPRAMQWSPLLEKLILNGIDSLDPTRFCMCGLLSCAAHGLAASCQHHDEL